MAGRCILLFSRGARDEARTKRIASRQLFDVARRRIERIARVAGVALVAPGVQRGATFGERLKNAFRDAAATYDEIAVVPIDVPQLSLRDVVRAFALLRDHDLVLGPSDDGGVYLIAGRPAAAERFASVRWLTPHVLEDLRRGKVAMLDRLIDVDTADNLANLAGLVPASLLAPPSWLPPPPIRCGTDSTTAISGRAPPR